MAALLVVPDDRAVVDRGAEGVASRSPLMRKGRERRWWWWAGWGGDARASALCWLGGVRFPARTAGADLHASRLCAREERKKARKYAAETSAYGPSETKPDTFSPGSFFTDSLIQRINY